MYKSIADIIYTPRSLQLKESNSELFDKISKQEGDTEDASEIDM